MRVRVFPSTISGTVTVPPSKSLYHRALLCAALADGVSHIRPLAESEDIAATRAAAHALGARVTPGTGGLRVEGCGGAVPSGPLTLDCGESGSTLRFLIPLCARGGGAVTLTGRGRLLERPQTVYRELFTARGVRFEQTDQSLTVEGALSPGEYPVNGSVSSQFITGLLLALPLLPGDSRIVIRPPFVSRPYVELTLSMMACFGVQAVWQGDHALHVPGWQAYRPADVTVEGDYSQLAILAGLGALAGEVTCLGVQPGSRQGDRAIVDFLTRMGAEVSAVPGGWHVQSAPLSGAAINIGDCPDLGPILAVLGAFAWGQTRLTGTSRLRIKESDRAEALVTELSRLGVEISSREDELIIHGGMIPETREAAVSGHGDHRIVMSLAVAALAGTRPVVIDGAEAVDKSYPGFFEDLSALGARWEHLHE